jgi:hypothetical protein
MAPSHAYALNDDDEPSDEGLSGSEGPDDDEDNNPFSNDPLFAPISNPLPNATADELREVWLLYTKSIFYSRRFFYRL